MIDLHCNRRSALKGWIAGALGMMGHARLPAAGPAAADPRAYGARGIGADFDDAPAIQEAVDAVWKRGGGVVQFYKPPAYYNLRKPIICRPGVSLRGDGSYPRLVASQPRKALLLAGNIHPDFISRARYDPLRPVAAADRSVRLASPTDAVRYRPGDQVFVASRQWGRTGGFGLPEYGWLNIVTGVESDRLMLREPIDVATEAQITPLADTIARNGIPLFFHADASISGLTLEAVDHIMDDSAMLRVDFTDNKVVARSAIYGNGFQHVRWIGNDFVFTRALGEQSMNSLNTVARNNRFTFRPGRAGDGRVFAGFYFQEFGRNLSVSDCTVDFGRAHSDNFLISIANAQRVVVERVAFRGAGASSLIYMGNAGTADFAVTGNMVRDCRFDIPEVVRLAMIRGAHSPYMHGNGIEDCVFSGNASVHDAFRLDGLRGRFSFARNRWKGGNCLAFSNSSGLVAEGNSGAGGKAALCRAMTS